MVITWQGRQYCRWHVGFKQIGELYVHTYDDSYRRVGHVNSRAVRIFKISYWKRTFAAIWVVFNPTMLYSTSSNIHCCLNTKDNNTRKMQGFRMVLLEVGYGCCGETQVSEQMHGLAIVCSIIFSHLIGVPHPYAAYKFSVFHFCKAILFVKSHQVCIS